MGLNYLINLNYTNSNVPEQKLDNCKILILGDSHVQKSLNPCFFNAAKNISQSAEPYFVTYWKLKKLLHTNKTIDTLLLGFSFHNISAFNDKKLIDPSWSSEMFYRIYPIEEFETLNGIEIDFWEYFKILAREMCLYPKKNHINYIGCYGNSRRSDISDYNTSIKRHFYYNNNNVGISTTSIDFLNKIITLCRDSKINNILITSPLHKEYLKRIPSNFTQEYLKLKNELTTNNGVPVLDFSSIVLNDTCFLNSDHLNESGARIFSNMVMDTLYVTKSRTVL